MLLGAYAAGVAALVGWLVQSQGLSWPAAAGFVALGHLLLASWRPMLLGTFGFLGNRALTLSLPALRDVFETELNRWLERRSSARVPVERP
jgi:hypothetical protein